jgi:RHS repeat-associated protein
LLTFTGTVAADAIRLTPQFMVTQPAQLLYAHADHLGTPRAITRPSDNALVWRWDNIDPFGNNSADENPNNVNGASPLTYNLRFPGQYKDRETGNHYNYFRDYNPGVGRYVQSDPIGLQGGLNTFGYVGGRPLVSTDSSGLFVDATGAYTAGSAVATATGTSFGLAASGIGASALVGVGIGLGFNYGWERLFGQPLGGSLYDLFQPRAGDGDYSPWSPDPEVNRQFVRDRDSVNDVKPSPYSNPNKPTCDEIRARIKFLEEIIARRVAFTNKWYAGDFNPGHAGRVATLQKEIEKLRARLNRGDCVC